MPDGLALKLPKSDDEHRFSCDGNTFKMFKYALNQQIKKINLFIFLDMMNTKQVFVC